MSVVKFNTTNILRTCGYRRILLIDLNLLCADIPEPVLDDDLTQSVTDLLFFKYECSADVEALRGGRRVQQVRCQCRGTGRPKPDVDGRRRDAATGQAVLLAQLRHRARSVQHGQVLPLAAAVDRQAQPTTTALHRDHNSVSKLRVRSHHAEVRLRAELR